MEKQLLTTGIVGKVTGLTPAQIALAERRGVIPAVVRTLSNHRLFSIHDIAALKEWAKDRPGPGRPRIKQ